MPEEILARLTYEQLIAELTELGDEVDAFRDMTPEAERELRQTLSAAGDPPPEDFRDIAIVAAGRRQVDIVRECLRRVDLATLASDSGYPETSLILFTCYRGDPPDPDSN